MARIVLIETTGSFMLVDPANRAEIPFNRPAVMEWTSFLEMRLGLGQLRILLAELKDETTDADFAGYLEASGSDMALAIASFEAEFGVVPEQGSEIIPVEKSVKVAPATKTKQ